MKAIVINEYGDEHKLTAANIPIPEINDNQILIKIKSIGVNPIDWKTRQGLRQKRYPFQFPIILGQEAAGIVAKVGKNVTDFSENDEVIAYGTPSNRGTYAEYFAIDADLAGHKPANQSFQAAAGLGLTGTTAWEALFEAGNLQAGQTVLILAGSGGVGSLAIQLAKNAGAHVITTTSGKNIDFVRSLGADEVIDYTTNHFSEKTLSVDLVFDTLGGNNQVDAFKVVKPGGKIVSIVETTEQADKLSEQYHVTFSKINGHAQHDVMTKLSQLFADNKLKITVAQQLPFSVENAQELQKISETGHVVGKLIMTI
ncbi:NADPH quinone reductase [Lentilactobacillus diolivorans DSM 14421]|uniref:NADPH quinone reductase n=2 Tax=Lentilactobacillus diolivorans TaxID=179838 RepID=A0A0R1SJG0_9LACO|nr:NADPH quinone reductase [Lentilactobacillus diolivorans DSM 14421]